MSAPRIAYLDIENAPHTAVVWSLHDPGPISTDALIEPGRVLMCGVRYSDEKRTRVFTERNGHTRMVREIHAALSKADALCGYNINKHDVPILAGEFEKAGLPPIALPTIDLYPAARRLRLASSKLGYVAPALDVGRKLDSGGMNLWLRVMKREPKAIKEMARYCARDVDLLPELRKRLGPHLRNVPILSDGGCPQCGEDEFVRRGVRRTRLYVIDRLSCRNCGAMSDGARIRRAA